MTKRDFILCAPLQLINHSNGVLTIVQLARSIEKAGHRAYLCVNGRMGNRDIVQGVDFDTYVPRNEDEQSLVDSVRQAQKKFGFRLLKDFSPQRIDECYVVYPEVVVTNPLGAKRVIRYFLNKDGIMTDQKVQASPNDFILAHSRTMHPEPHFVCYFAAVNPLFHGDDTYPAEQRKMDLLYLGKGADYGVKCQMTDAVTITRTWPDTKEQLAIMLRNTRFFYTADACSSTNLEALFCGAIPVFLYNGPWSDAEIDGFEPGAFPRVRVGMSRNDINLADFEVERKRYIDRTRSLEESWDGRVAQLVEKVATHFGDA